MARTAKQSGKASNKKSKVLFENRLWNSAILKILSFVIAGVATSLFTDIFKTWAIAIKNASSGFFHKFADTYVISAASAELSDGAFGLSSIFGILFLFAIWFFLKAISMDIEQSSQEILDISDYGNALENQDVAKLTAKLIETDKARISKLKRKIQDNRFFLRVARILFWFMAISSVYGITRNEVSYALLKGFRRDVVRVRPYISDPEYYILNRQWVMMKSCEDYKAITEIIAEYEKRAETDKNPDSENE